MAYSMSFCFTRSYPGRPVYTLSNGIYDQDLSFRIPDSSRQDHIHWTSEFQKYSCRRITFLVCIQEQYSLCHRNGSIYYPWGHVILLPYQQFETRWKHFQSRFLPSRYYIMGNSKPCISVYV